MILAVDVFYAENRAKAAGILFRDWEDAEPLDTVAAYIDDPLEYEPGSFYKRELPCIRRLLEEVDRGGSEKPLYVTAAGMEPAVAAGHIRNMHGPYCFPHLLKLLDTCTKTDWQA